MLELRIKDDRAVGLDLQRRLFKVHIAPAQPALTSKQVCANHVLLNIRFGIAQSKCQLMSYEDVRLERARRSVQTAGGHKKEAGTNSPSP